MTDAEQAVDPRLDPELIEQGDTRNVVDRYRFWSVEAIRADLDESRSALHIAIENLDHDLNIGSIVRTGNAFNVGGVHIVGRRRWNRRGAMVTDRYLDIIHQPEPADLAGWAQANGYAIIGIDNVPGCTDLEASPLPERSILVFGQESNGISPELLAECTEVRQIPMYGSTRSMNVAAAAAIAIHSWSVTHQYRG
ncbi:TrmH family RNA methyltransferase [Flaviflexus salsibiostraticola]|uniref:TrmH family RNA methyltransferase n=1 Tax=Flaviflexus salsibiostraticola TaxID=1282737 RepID=UPI001FECA79B|nr:TrmH family RNA methyltransferase [Flaviflexus salsibiostraticola]